MVQLILSACLLLFTTIPGQVADSPKRILLIGQGPDNHPPRTHEYMLGIAIVAKKLNALENVSVTIAKADEPWREGPELIDKADAVVIFVSEGAKWMQADPRRFAALKRLAKRKGGIAGLHWGVGAREQKYVNGCLELLGGCHGGPDRKYKFLKTDVTRAQADHPILRGLKDVSIRDEFYYQMHFNRKSGDLVPLLQADIDGNKEPVAWAWTRPDGGRSFGFSGLHFHENWLVPEYERFITQGIIWTINGPIPASGVPTNLKEMDLDLPKAK